MHVFQPVNPEDIEEGAYSFVGQKIIITCKDGDKQNRECKEACSLFFS